MIRILSFDPGETTGWCLIEVRPEIVLIASGEAVSFGDVKRLFLEYHPHEVVYEIFRLYAWKAQVKSWSTFPEIEVIGVIKFLCEELFIPITGQDPAERKFFTDAKLKELDMWPASKHAADAVRHGLLYAKYKRGLAKNK